MSEAVEEKSTEQVDTQPAPEAKSLPAEFSPKWDRDALLNNAPEDVDKDALGKWLEKTHDPYAAFKSNSHAQKKISEYANADKLLDPEKREDLYKALGVPEDVSGYKLSEDLGLPESEVEALLKTASDLKLDNEKANALGNVVKDLMLKGRTAQEERNAAAEEQTVAYLESVWGHHDTEAYQNNLSLVEDVLSSKGIDPNSDEANAIFRNGKLVEMLNDLGKMMDQSDLPRVKSGDLSTRKTLENEFSEISAKIAAANKASDMKTAKELEPKRRAIWQKLQRTK